MVVGKTHVHAQHCLQQGMLRCDALGACWNRKLAQPAQFLRLPWETSHQNEATRPPYRLCSRKNHELPCCSSLTAMLSSTGAGWGTEALVGVLFGVGPLKATPGETLTLFASLVFIVNGPPMLCVSRRSFWYPKSKAMLASTSAHTDYQ